MRVVILLLLFFMCSIPSHAYRKDFKFEQISSKGGFTFDAIESIVEDKNGFVWFSCYNGLFQYNTSEINKYSYNPQDSTSLPSNRVYSLYKDKSERVWVCTEKGLCYFNYATNTFNRIEFKNEADTVVQSPVTQSILQYADKQYLIIIGRELYTFNIDEKTLHRTKIAYIDRPIISCIGINENDQIYVGTITGKVFVSNPSTLEFSLLYETGKSSIYTINYFDNKFWLGLVQGGVDVIDNGGKLKIQYREEFTGNTHLIDNDIKKIIKRKNGEVWIATIGGLMILSAEGNYAIRQNEFNGLPHSSIFSLYVDKHDGVWLGTWSGGLAYYNEKNYKFPHIQSYSKVAKNVISSFAEDKDGNILIGTENFGIKKFDPHNYVFIDYDTDFSEVAHVKCMSKDAQDRLWIGTFQDGLWYMEDENLKRIKNIKNIYYSILVDSNRAWVGSRGGFLYYDIDKDTVCDYKNRESLTGTIRFNRIWNLFNDSKQNIWLSTDLGLANYNRENDKFTLFVDENTININEKKIYTIAEDNSNMLWIGTSGEGIYIYDSGENKFKEFILNDKIKEHDIYSIIRDKKDNMWFSSNYGVYVYYSKTKKLQHFSSEDGLLSNQFNPNSGFISSEGTVYFGGTNGFIIIDPDVVLHNKTVADAFLSKLLINNKQINDSNVYFVNSRNITELSKLELDYDKNTITLGFVANNFIKKTNNRFRYRVINYINQWEEIEYGKELSLTKIPPGKYMLEVLAVNNDGVLSENIKQVQIIIHPPIWLTWYAFVTYVLIFIAIVLLVIKDVKARIALRKLVRSERYTIESNEQLFSEKVKFFTNVSHEFKTPLTLILSPLDKLTQKFTGDSATMEHVAAIRRNADRLLRLTNQIMDFRFIELNKSTLKTKNEDIVALCKTTHESFEYHSYEQNKTCTFASEYESLLLPIDAVKIEKVVYNLLSNAIKYTDEKGNIKLEIRSCKIDESHYKDVFWVGDKFFGDALQIKITDDGIGIKAEALPNIFDRFYVHQGDDRVSTGIGLHICKEYISLHKGNIVISSKHNEGTAVIVALPVNAFSDLEKEEGVIHYQFKRSEEQQNRIEEEVMESNKKTLLLVEDNDELRIFMKKVLSPKFNVVTAKDGDQAFAIAVEIMPDIIISDIMMKKMNGLQLTDKIRKTAKINHIPIILLTSSSDHKHKIEGLNKGVNAFLSKPLDEQILLARINNIFSNRDTLKEKLTLQTGRSIEDRMVETFEIKARRIVEENLQNPSFEMAEFANQMGISRSSIHRKMKSLTGLTPSEFIKEIRLEKAIKLMKTENLNIDEVGALAGFNSTSYFIRTFKKKFGITPMSYRTKYLNQKKETRQ